MKKIMSLLFLIPTLTFCVQKNIEKPNILVSIAPQKYWVQRIAGNKVNTDVLLKSNYNDYKHYPVEEELIKLQKCDVFLKIGVYTEKPILKRVPGVKTADTSEGIELRNVDLLHNLDRKLRMGIDEPISLREAKRRNVYQVFGKDKLVWINPKDAKIICNNIYKALVVIAPQDSMYFQDNLKLVNAELDEFHKLAEAELERGKGHFVLVLNTSIGYIADEFGFYQIPVHLENKTEAILELNAIINYAQTNNIKLLIVPNEDLKADGEKVAKSFDGIVEVFDPYSENYFENMNKLLKILYKIKEEK